MEEKVFKTMNGCGILNFVLGIIILVTGIASGVLLIISSVKLLTRKSNLMF